MSYDHATIAGRAIGPGHPPHVAAGGEPVTEKERAPGPPLGWGMAAPRTDKE